LNFSKTKGPQDFNPRAAETERPKKHSDYQFVKLLKTARLLGDHGSRSLAGDIGRYQIYTGPAVFKSKIVN
jgi:hypothetical protein